MLLMNVTQIFPFVSTRLAVICKNQNTFRKCVVVMMIHVIDPITVENSEDKNTMLHLGVIVIVIVI